MQLAGTGINSITNSGMIIGGNGTAIKLYNASNDTVTNTGTILGGIDFSGGNNKLVNSGLITNINASQEFFVFGATTSNIIFGIGDDTFSNKGTINGWVDLGFGLNKAENAKDITGKDLDGSTVLGGSGADTFTNTKGATLAGGVDLFTGNNTFTNAGTVGKDAAEKSYVGFGDIDIVKNSGTFEGDVDLGDGIDQLTNSGLIKESVFLGGQNDVFTNTGQVLGEIYLGSGDDVFKGGSFAETVYDGEGSDKISLGGGNDTVKAFGGAGDGENGLNGSPAPDEVDGGTGIDTYDGFLVGGILVNLDSVDHWIILKGTAMDGVGTFVDKLKGIENVTGSDSFDAIYGSSSANVIKGNDGDDNLFGLAGNDTIEGNDDGDYINGGLGADFLTGGDGSDQFVYTSLKDSGLTKATRDEIMDFVDGIDTILLNFDANTTTPDFEGFGSPIVNGKFSGAASELRVYQTATGWMVEGDLNGDAKADFSIAVRDAGHSIIWHAGDFG